MVVWGNKITISDDVAEMMSNKNDVLEVIFTYINVKTGKETDRRMPLGRAITLAESRREDKRYKNFEYHISK
jgi:hypothetical protein